MQGRWVISMQLAEKGETVPVEEKPGIIGMVVPSMNDPFIYEITPYLQKAFSSIGLGSRSSQEILMTCVSTGSPTR
ncbi:MAG: hypothetical protein U5L72_11250 [Bacteroidales bacterium]|nr:hypothetical protein [Bacteroidales bacterium]